MGKQLTAQWLLTELQNMKKLGTDLSKVQLSYRFDTDSDVEPITYVGEGLYDAQTNNILEEIIFMTDASDYEGEDVDDNFKTWNESPYGND